MILTTDNFWKSEIKTAKPIRKLYLSIYEIYVLMGKKGEKLRPSVRLCFHTCKLAMVWYHQNRRDVMK